MSVADFEKKFTPKVGKTLIVGSRVYGAKEDRRLRYADVVGVDMQAGVGVDTVWDLEDVPMPMDFEHVECMSVLEHSRRPWLMATNIERMMVSGATLFVTVPFVWKVHGYPDDYWRMTISGVKSLFSNIVWLHEAYSGRHLTDGDNIPQVRAGEDWPHMSVTETCLFGYRR